MQLASHPKRVLKQAQLHMHKIIHTRAHTVLI